MSISWGRVTTVALLAGTMLSVTAGTAVQDATAAKTKKPKVTTLRHVGDIEGMAGAQVSFTLLKRGRSFVGVRSIKLTNILLSCLSDQPPTVRFTQTFSASLGRMPMSQTGLSHKPPIVGFATDDLPVEGEGIEGGRKSVWGTFTRSGKQGSGYAEVTYWDGTSTCGGSIVSWKTDLR